MKEQVKAAQLRFHATPERHRELRLWLRMLTSTGMLEKQIRERLPDKSGHVTRFEHVVAPFEIELQRLAVTVLSALTVIIASPVELRRFTS